MFTKPRMICNSEVWGKESLRNKFHSFLFVVQVDFGYRL